MKILLLGPVHRRKEFLEQKGKLPFLRSQGQQSWVNALGELGHNVTVFRYTDSYLLPPYLSVYGEEFFYHTFPRWYARWRRLRDVMFYYSFDNNVRNKKLLETAHASKPQLLCISGGIASVFPETIQKIKDTYTCPVLLFSGINPLVGSSSLEKILVKEGIVDSVIENDRGYARLWEQLGAKKTVVLPISSVDPELHRKMKLTKSEQDNYGSDVCFVGTLTKDRQEKLLKLRHFKLKIWGDVPGETGLDPVLREYYFGEAFGEKMIKIFNAAKIVINFQPADMTHGGNMRAFEIPGSGAFQLADRIDEKWFTDKKEYVKFTTMEDLEKMISYYLTHPAERQEIADAGYKKAHAVHTYRNHFQTLLKSYVS